MRHALALAWVAFVYLMIGTSPTHAWLDSGELAAASFELGVMHPPGAPGLAHLGRLFVAVPLGPAGFRVALLSSALSAATVYVLALVLARHRVHPAIRWIVGLWLLTHATFVFHARVAEIYALASLLTVLVLATMDRKIPRGRRGRMRLWATLFAVWGSLAFGDLRLALVPWIVGAWLLGLARREAWARWAPLAVAAALLVVLALPMASARDPFTDWGDPEGPVALWHHLQATSIRAAFADEILPSDPWAWWRAAGAFGSRAVDDLGPVGALLALAGALHLSSRRARPRRRALARAACWIGLVHAFYAVGVNPMGEVDRQTGGLLAPLAALVLGLALQAWTGRLGPARWAVLPLVAAAVVGPPALRVLGDEVVATRSWAPHAWTTAALDRVPPGGLLLTQSDDLAAGTLYARVVEGARPDVVSLPAQHLYRPPPGRLLREAPVAAAAWTRARAAGDEGARARAMVASWPGGVAAEGPGTLTLAALSPPDAPQPLPVTVLRPLPTGGGDPGAWAAAEAASWLPRLPARADRLRLARALASWARAHVGAAGGLGAADAGRVRESLAVLRVVLEQVDPAHVSSLVTAGALLDRLGYTREAISLTERALTLDPHREAARRNLALYRSRP